MAGMRYDIRLRMHVDTSQIDRAQAKINKLNASSVSVGGRGGGGGGLRSASQGSPFLQRVNSAIGASSAFSNAGFLANVSASSQKFKTLGGNFLANMITPVGWMRNIQNMGGALASVGKIAGGVVPVLGAIGGALVTIGKFALVGKAISMASTGVPLLLGSRLLQSQRMGEAGAQLMRFDMAKKGLGGDYRSAFNSATQLAGEYGYSRTGMLDAINMFTGLNVGNQGKLNRSQATDISRIIGKISALGNLPFEKVSTNVQQLLGQPKTQVRDVRELIGQAPFINKLAQQRMARTGVTGDIREYLKDKANLLAVLAEFDKMVESNPLMKARGKIALVKENFYLKIAEILNPYWDSIVSGIGALYDNFGVFLSDKLKGFSPQTFAVNVAKFATDVDNIIRGVAWFIGKISGAFTELSNVWGLVPDFMKNLADLGRLGLPAVGKSVNVYTPGSNGSISTRQVFTTTSGYRDQLAAYNNMVIDSSRSAIVNAGALSSGTVNDVAAILAGKATDIGGIPYAGGFKGTSKQLSDAKSYIRKKLSNLDYTALVAESGGLPNRFKSEVFLKMISADRETGGLGLFGTGGANALNDNTAAGLSSATKGSTALIINFNKEIVSMPISIAQVGDMAQAWDTYLRARVEETLTRGLNIALNNATGAI